MAAALALAAVAGGCKTDEAKTPTGPALPVPETYVAQLTGAKERPTPVVTNATGTATFVFNQTTNGIDYTINVTGLSALPTGMHIHAPADTGQATGVIVGFNGYAVATSGTLATGTIFGVSATISLDSLRALIRTGKVYANVHTTTNPGGEIRGHLVRQ